MVIAYVQCDCKYNKWLLEKIEDKYVVEYTIERAMQLGCKKIVAGIYECDENERLVAALGKLGVEVILSDEENVNIRFLDIVTSENADYVVRIGGDQVLIDVEKTKEILKKMREAEQEWFYDELANCILPDIVSMECLKKHWEDVRKENRYFEGLKRQSDIKEYRLPYPMLIAFNFRVNSNESMRICKDVIINQLDIYELSQKLMRKLYCGNYLVQTGLWGSWLLADEYQDYFYDENKEINPWWGKTIIDFLKPRLNKKLSVFEWGAGNSTLFWSQNVKDVVSIEYDKKWYEKLIDEVPENVKLKYYGLEYGGDYCKAILDEDKKFDIVLIDGRDRVRCAKNAISMLKEDGVIIWDDTEREYYKEGFETLLKNGFKYLQFKSVAYKIAGFGHSTSIFYRSKNVLGI